MTSSKCHKKKAVEQQDLKLEQEMNPVQKAAVHLHLHRDKLDLPV
jgi:hypothetical protein